MLWIDILCEDTLSFSVLITELLNYWQDKVMKDGYYH